MTKYNQNSPKKFSLKKFFQYNNIFSSYGLITLVILIISLLMGIQMNLIKNKKFILENISLEKVSNPNFKYNWIGLYNYFILKKYLPLSISEYSFSISLKNIWYFLSRSFIHISLLATFFNCFWFVILGNTIETKIGKIRFFLLILILSITTNFLQYTMTGASSYGLSGIISGFVSFILIRKKKYPWESYNIQKETLFFIIFCIFSSFILQTVITLIQFSGKSIPHLPIPNTSLISGLLIGYLIGKAKMIRINQF